MSSFLAQQNISLYTLPAAYILCLIPQYYAIIQYSKYTSPIDTVARSKKNNGQIQQAYGFNRAEPRSFLSRLEANPDPKLTAEAKGTIARAAAASLNGFENLGFYAGAVVAANLGLFISRGQAKGSLSSPVSTNVLCLSWLAARSVYITVYIQGVRGGYRAIWYWVQLLICVTFYIRAGNAMRRV